MAEQQAGRSGSGPAGFSRRDLLKIASIAALCYGSVYPSSKPLERTAPAVTVLRGVNLNGAEFGVGRNLGGSGTGGVFSNVNRGTHDGNDGSAYHYPTNGDFAYLASRGVGMVRLPIRWERLQPALGGRLDAAELGRLVTAIDLGHANGMKVSPALVSYGAYWVHENGVGVRRAIGAPGGPSVAQFGDFWSRMAEALVSRSEKIGSYGITGEPILDPVPGYSPPRLWEFISQQACGAIEAIDRTTPIAVSVYGYNLHTNPQRAHEYGPWITGVANPVWYEAHQYLTVVEGRNSYAQAVRHAEQLGYTAGTNPDALHTRGFAEIDRFHAWLNGAVGYIGETGWCKDDSVEQWNALGSRLYERHNAYGFHVTAWGAGSWWPRDESLLIYGASAAASGADATLDTAYSSAAVIEAPANLSHPSRRLQNLPGSGSGWGSSTTGPSLAPP